MPPALTAATGLTVLSTNGRPLSERCVDTLARLPRLTRLYLPQSPQPTGFRPAAKAAAAQRRAAERAMRRLLRVAPVGLEIVQGRALLGSEARDTML